jgi:hypothetical protein
MIYDTRPFLEMVPKVRHSLKAESARRQGGGLGGSGTIEQLEYMVNELDRVEAEIRKGRLPVGTSQLECARIVVDSWPCTDEDLLGLEIMELSRLYQQLCIR